MSLLYHIKRDDAILFCEKCRRLQKTARQTVSIGLLIIRKIKRSSNQAIKQSKEALGIADDREALERMILVLN